MDIRDDVEMFMDGDSSLDEGEADMLKAAAYG